MCCISLKSSRSRMNCKLSPVYHLPSVLISMNWRSIPTTGVFQAGWFALQHIRKPPSSIKKNNPQEKKKKKTSHLEGVAGREKYLSLSFGASRGKTQDQSICACELSQLLLETMTFNWCIAINDNKDRFFSSPGNAALPPPFPHPSRPPAKERKTNNK